MFLHPCSKSFHLPLLEKVIPLVVDHDERWEVLDLDSPDGLHAKLWVLQDLHFLDAVLS